MNAQIQPLAQWPTVMVIACLALFQASTPAFAQPAQKPLLTSTSGARPNLMLTLDNSGSMAFPYHETYSVFSDSNSQIELRQCPSPYMSDLTGAWIVGGVADLNNNNRCIYQSGNNYYYSDSLSVRYSPRLYVSGSGMAQRSSDVNPIYYNPRITYNPRVDASGNALVPSDGIVFVSNQNSAAFEYELFENLLGQTRFTHSMYASNPSTVGYTSRYKLSYAYRIPQHITYTSTSSSTPGFTYAYCTSVTNGPSGEQLGCASYTSVTVKRGATTTITLPTGHKRTDCTGNTCSTVQEINNILNWYRYYAYRAPAVATAIGQALANPAYESKMRVGYTPINERGSAITSNVAEILTSTSLFRGVRTLQKGSTANQQTYSWLYSLPPWGGTPLHNSVDKVADYYKVTANAKENPWTSDPSGVASGSNPELSCRRSFNLLFSDGAWNNGSSTNSQNYDATQSPLFTRTGTAETFRYQPTGLSTQAARRAYTPYPSSATTGLADLTAQYFWHTDLRTALDNRITTRPGQPTFWQNMATYTVGYLIKPSGEVPSATSGLTFQQIKNYQKQYIESGYTAATKPTWPTGTPNTGTDQNRIDDFIQAGFTGGGAGYSVTTADDVRRTFDLILSDILNSSGNDAGVAASSGSGAFNDFTDQLKYTTEYKTVDNTGDIKAFNLDASGNVTSTVPAWVASEKTPAHNNRNIYSITGRTSAFEFKGNYSSLPADVQTALYADTVPTDASFVNYLRGQELVQNNVGELYRLREKTVAASVNSPPQYMGGRVDNAYDIQGNVDGASSYFNFQEKKRTYPASVFAATNAGVVHVLDAKAGTELAAFMPRNSMTKLQNFASSSYSFEYVLDGPLAEHDIYNSSTGWRHLAIGTGGRAGKFVYALGSPLNAGTLTNNRQPTQSDFVWEIGASDVTSSANVPLGYISNQAGAGQTENGQWVAVLNSGHYSNGTAGLIVVNALTGQHIRSIALPTGYGTGRGLSGITLIRDHNRRIVGAYAGDANGNLWRFDLRGASTSWNVSYGKPLFTAPNNQPVFAAPAWQNHTEGGTIVVFATGMLLEESDLADVGKKTVYGIWDPTVVGNDANLTKLNTIASLPLQTQTLELSSRTRGKEKVSGVVQDSDKYFYRVSKNTVDWKTQRGWRLELGQTTVDPNTGERVIGDLDNLGSSVVLTSVVISNTGSSAAESCDAASTAPNYIYVLDALTGGSKRSFDVNADQKLDDYAVAFIPQGGFSRGNVLTVRTNQNYYSSGIVNTPQGQALRLQNSYGRGQVIPPDPSNPSTGTPSKSSCSAIDGSLTGTQETVSIGIGCDVVGWSRNWKQLLAPPAN